MVFPRFCRVCACEVNKPCDIENNPEKPELPLLLKRYMPEFNIKVANACLCTDCVYILYTFHNFKGKCLRTEQDIRLHIRKHPQAKAANLNDIFAPRETIKKDTEFCLETAVGTIKEETIESHQTTTTDFICEICSRVFSSELSLRDHRRQQHGCERYQCDKCSREFTLKKSYDVHLAYHKKPNAGRYTCKICNFVYPSMHSLKRHTTGKHSSDDQKRFQCELCPKRFTERSGLKQHMRTHTGERLFKCSLCDKYATTVATELDRHIRTMHNTEAKLKVVCTFSSCRRVFLSEKALRVHKEKFHRSERYQCDKCSRDFLLKTTYDVHIAYHKKPDANRFVCDECNFVYQSYSGLNRHNFSKHSSDDQKPFQCDLCRKRFVEKSTLKVHMRIHAGHKPYKCSVCKYAANQFYNLYNHASKKHKGVLSQAEILALNKYTK